MGINLDQKLVDEFQELGKLKELVSRLDELLEFFSKTKSEDEPRDNLSSCFDNLKKLREIDNWFLLRLYKDKMDFEILERGINSFFGKIWKNYDAVDAAVFSFLDREDGFFFVNLSQAVMISNEIFIKILVSPYETGYLFGEFVFLQLYLHNFEAMCCFLKPLVEDFLGQQIEEDEEQVHQKVYNHFLKWLESDVRKIFKEKIDVKLRHCIAHASYILNQSDGSICLRDMVSRRRRTYEFNEFLEKLLDLVILCQLLRNKLLDYIIEFFMRNEFANDLKMYFVESYIDINYIIAYIKMLRDFLASMIESLEDEEKNPKKIPSRDSS
ncbi:MAG: hypothetical protein HWN65_12490 [Candidatus Helarchaeota archaeon]|nr:hypothetical protein [Candidatus Helarchaeota archaeon]